MPIGNQEIWDNGIGAGATNVIFGQQPQQTNYNPGALGADPNAQPAAATAPIGATGDVEEPGLASDSEEIRQKLLRHAELKMLIGTSKDRNEQMRYDQEWKDLGREIQYLKTKQSLGPQV